MSGTAFLACSKCVHRVAFAHKKLSVVDEKKIICMNTKWSCRRAREREKVKNIFSIATEHLAGREVGKSKEFLHFSLVHPLERLTVISDCVYYSLTFNAYVLCYFQAPTMPIVWVRNKKSALACESRNSLVNKSCTRRDVKIRRKNVCVRKCDARQFINQSFLEKPRDVKSREKEFSE